MNDRTELIASFEGRVMGGVLHNGGYIHVPQEEAEQILALLKELLKSQPEQKFFVDSDGKITPLPIQPQWISVNDRLPRIDEDVLILYESKVSRKTGYAITCLKDSFYFGSTQIPYQTPQWIEPWQYFRENNVITHWMPLPEPPKEEKQ